MKTEPIEARIYISSYSCENGAGDMIIDREDAEEAVNIAFREGQSNPKIKQLQWVMTGAKDNPDNIITNTPFNYYRIDNYGDGIWYLNSDKFDEEEFSSLEEAKKAAQRDFEQKVKECLE